MISKSKIILAILLITALFFTIPSSGQVEEEHFLGLKLATPDQLRGVPLAFTPYSGDELPDLVDLSQFMPPPGHQGRQNSCVAWAVVYAVKSYQERIEEGIPYVQDGRISAYRVFSPSFVYNQINNGQNVPTYFIDAFNILSNQGVVTWADMPYNQNDFTSKPSATLRQKAKKYRIDFWRQVNIQDTKEIKAHLHAGYPVIVGVKVDRAFIEHPARTIWNSMGEAIGGHAMVVVGYSEQYQAFRLLNSWGQDWADNGFCWVDYTHFHRVANEGYVVKDALNTPTPQPDPRPRTTPQPQQAVLTVTKVEHNTNFPNQPELGYFMKFTGTLFIPPNLGYKNQVAIHFYSDLGGGRQGNSIYSVDQHYMDPDGFVACGTAVFDIPSQGLNTTWVTWVPYNAFDVPKGRYVKTGRRREYQKATNYLLAIPTLFVDNFGVSQGKLLQFSISW